MRRRSIADAAVVVVVVVNAAGDDEDEDCEQFDDDDFLPVPAFCKLISSIVVEEIVVASLTAGVIIIFVRLESPPVAEDVVEDAMGSWDVAVGLNGSSNSGSGELLRECRIPAEFRCSEIFKDALPMLTSLSH